MRRIVVSKPGARIASFGIVVAVASTYMCADPVCVAGAAAIRTVPADTTISPGESFTLRFEVGTPCASPGRWDTWDTVSVDWTTGDTNVVRLDTLSGLVTGLATGDARVSASAPESPFYATVHVR